MHTTTLLYKIIFRAIAGNRLVMVSLLVIGELLLISHDTDEAKPVAIYRQAGQALRGEVPVLCYHQVRNWKSSDSRSSRVFILPVQEFKAQMKLLHDSGYHVILPGQLIAYFETGLKLPAKPVVLTFDDGTASQYENVLPELDRFGFKAVFFIMTVALDKPAYMSTAQISDLAARGHIIGCHTWDHPDIARMQNVDWHRQLKMPRIKLQDITRQPVEYFAYPYGSWDRVAADTLKRYGFRAAFQLHGKRDREKPEFTVRRILVSGYWHTSDLVSAIRKFEDGR